MSTHLGVLGPGGHLGSTQGLDRSFSLSCYFRKCENEPIGTTVLSCANNSWLVAWSVWRSILRPCLGFAISISYVCL